LLPSAPWCEFNPDEALEQPAEQAAIVGGPHALDVPEADSKA
jgi:hypothetical protein